MNGKQKRMNSILENGKAIMIPMDHGLSDGPLKGLANIHNTIHEVSLGGASAVILHKGIIKSLPEVPNTSVIMHASAGTSVQSDTFTKVLVGTVEEAVKLGADGFSLHINVGGAEKEPDMIRKLGTIAEECDIWQMPLLAMMYPRGNNISKPIPTEKVALSARVGAELGADIVKSIYTGDVDSFSRVVDGCPVPVVVAGGQKVDSVKDILKMVSDVMEAGAIGVTIGRNVFGSDNPQLLTKAIREIVLRKSTVTEALGIFSEENIHTSQSVSSPAD